MTTLPPPPISPPPPGSPAVRRSTVAPKKICDCVLEAVLGFGKDSDVASALEDEGATTLTDVLTMTEDDVHALECRPPKTKPEDPGLSLSRVKCRKLTLLSACHQKILKDLDRDPHDVSSMLEWQRLTSAADFEKFRASCGATITEGSLSSSKESSKTLAESFQCGIKRDVTHCPTLKEDKHWSTWMSEVTTLAETHEVSEAFDLSCAPGAKEKKELFKLQCDFVESVFNKHVQTSSGKVLVARLQKQKKSGQETCRKLSELCEKSPQAQKPSTRVKPVFYTPTAVD